MMHVYYVLQQQQYVADDSTNICIIIRNARDRGHMLITDPNFCLELLQLLQQLLQAPEKGTQTPYEQFSRAGQAILATFIQLTACPTWSYNG
jgi:hypothetical protein